KMRLFQKDAYIGIDFLEKKSEVIKLKEAKDANVFTFDIATPTGNRTIAIANPPVPNINAIRQELVEFKSAIEQNTKTIVSEIDGLMAMDVAHQILQKIGNNVLTRS
ncbi:MAG: gfo/Idh/MocA family oxidoreductase, partial [Chitinophagaceae bacterium]|nr:gfo/Idh/MocA family oxidoreductase [Chitinophagaceae bacterium]